MRRFVLLVTATSLLVVAPAGAETLGEPQDVVFEAPVPCGFACGFAEDPTAPRYDCTAEGRLVPDAHDSIEVVAPEGATRLRLQVFPTVDWDSFICSTDGDTLGFGVNIFGNPCSNAVGQERVPIGCTEVTEIDVVPGERYVLLAFNFADPLPLPGTYVFLAE